MYTFRPTERFARAYGRNLRISTKSATLLCRVIRKKPLTRARRLLDDLRNEVRSLDGQYYTKTAREMALLLNSCEKNADALNLDKERLMVHASAQDGTIMRRRRRKSAYGSRLKSTHVEIMLIERGKGGARKADVKVVKSEKELEKVVKDVAEKVGKKAVEKAKEEKPKESAKPEPKKAKEKKKQDQQTKGKS